MQLKCSTAYWGWRVIKRFVERISESSITICHTNYVVSCSIKGAAYRYLLLSITYEPTNLFQSPLCLGGAETVN
jgi:hypothetical protein